jgi:hypothetical protein
LGHDHRERNGHTDAVQVAVIACLWHASGHYTPVHVVLVRDLHRTKPYDIAGVTTDTTATAAAIVERQADRWSIEQAIKDGQDLLGAGDAPEPTPDRRRTHPAVRDAQPVPGMDRPEYLVWWRLRVGTRFAQKPGAGAVSGLWLQAGFDRD